MSTEIDSTNNTRVTSWLDMMKRRAEEDKNELLGQVAENLRYFITHLDEWESGAFDYTNPPHFNDEVKWMTKYCVQFGSQLVTTHATLHLVSDTEGTFVGLYGHEENAENRATERSGFKTQPITLVARDIENLVTPLVQAEGSAPKAVGANLQYLLDHEDEFLDNEVSPSDLPELDENARWLTVYAVLFGMLWEYSYPGLTAVFNGKQFCELHHDPRKASERAEALGSEHYAQQVSVADGDIDPEEIIPDMPEVS